MASYFILKLLAFKYTITVETMKEIVKIEYFSYQNVTSSLSLCTWRFTWIYA